MGWFRKWEFEVKNVELDLTRKDEAERFVAGVNAVIMEKTGLQLCDLSIENAKQKPLSSEKYSLY